MELKNGGKINSSNWFDYLSVSESIVISQKFCREVLSKFSLGLAKKGLTSFVPWICWSKRKSVCGENQFKAMEKQNTKGCVHSSQGTIDFNLIIQLMTLFAYYWAASRLPPTKVPYVALLRHPGKNSKRDYEIVSHTDGKYTVYPSHCRNNKYHRKNKGVKFFRHR